MARYRSPADFIACHECDWLHRRRPLQVGETARCARCGALLYRHNPAGLSRATALLWASLLLYGIANAFPFLTLHTQNYARETTLLGCIAELYHQHMPGLAAFTFGILLLVPLLRLLGLLYVLVPLGRGRRWPQWPRVWRGVAWLSPWSMMEIYLLGAIIALVKLAAMGTIILGVAFWAFLALVFTMAWAGYNIDREALWQTD